MSETFNGFHQWGNGRTLLKLVVSEKLSGPEIFFVNIAWIDEKAHIVCFVDPKTRSYFPPFDFSNAIIYVKQFALEAVRPTGDPLIFEEQAEGDSASSIELL
jgi:hypothetical protein